MFPEGDCNEGKSVLPFHTGAVRLAIEANVPIVPIGIYLDPVKVWKRETIIGNAKIVFTWYRMGWYGITYGERISLEGKVEERNFIRHKTVELHTIVEKLARESKKMCKLAIYQGKRKAKRRFHTALRFAYRFVCFLIFTKIHMYVL